MFWKFSWYIFIAVQLSLMSLLSFLSGLYLLMKDLSIFIEWSVGSWNTLNFDISIMMDWMGMLFLSTVLFISSLVVFYSHSYMYSESSKERFVLLVVAFVCSMALLILSPNLVSILLGWDGLGLVSYCLVIFYQNKKSAAAGMITALSNRIGDVCLILSLGLGFFMGSFSFSLWTFMPDSSPLNLWIATFIMIGATTKSAQIPFSAWLPAAMAAPTPVSALVHSSTLVTAGVYLLIRFSPLIETQLINPYLVTISTLTMFMAGLSANFEYDLKKIIALSTLSQLGVMMFAISLNLSKLAFFHLISHALFKALLFLSAGLLIHNLNNTQDIRNFGSITLVFPLSSTIMNMANLSLCGFPFLAGFYSKDMIIEMNLMNNWNTLITLIFIAATGLTSLYSMRLVYYSMIHPYMNLPMNNCHESDLYLVGPMFLMGFMSIVSGSSLSWLVFPTPSVIFIPNLQKIFILFMVLSSMMLGLNALKSSIKTNSMTSWFSANMWFLPQLSSFIVSLPYFNMSKIFLKNQDQGWTEKLSSQGMYESSGYFSQVIQKTQLNSIKIFMIMFFILILPLFFVYL
uniref:NADH-ubiquinone oxidoreductase chain 5 n=1 Tax=Gondwanalimnadia sp. MT-2020 TaxID=2731355 RepID=A0A6M4SPH1_9CRUS|nr:NADH dehydrogenase subunit 5 [Gondwanalimnadia sp. MT-2020]